MSTFDMKALQRQFEFLASQGIDLGQEIPADDGTEHAMPAPAAGGAAAPGAPAGAAPAAAGPNPGLTQRFLNQIMRGVPIPVSAAAGAGATGTHAHGHHGHAHGHHGHPHPGHAHHHFDDDEGLGYDDDEDEDEDDLYEGDEDEPGTAGGALAGDGEDGYFYGDDPYGEAGAGGYEAMMVQHMRELQARQNQPQQQQQQLDHAQYLQQLHQLQELQRQQQEAEDAEAEDEDPDAADMRDAAAEKERGNDALRREDFTAAVEHYTAAIDLWPHDWVFFANRAAAHIKLGEWKAAVADCDEALRLEPNSPKPLYRLALCHLSQAQFSEAKAALARLEGGAAADPSVRKLAGEIAEAEDALRRVDMLLHEDKTTEAEAELAPVAARIENTVPLRILRARVLLGHGRVDQAQKLLLALAKQPENSANVEIVLWRGVAFYQDGQEDLAQRHMQEVLRVDPDNKKALALFKLMRKLESSKADANALFKAGKADEAVRAFSAALQLDARNAQYNSVILGNRAAAYMQLQQWNEAAADCTKSLSLKAENAKLHARRARCWLGLNLIEDAIRDFERSLKIEALDSVQEELKMARVSLKRSKQTSFYSLLQVSVTASVDDIKRAYRKLAMQWHPDRQTGPPAALKAAEDKFKKITEAYEVLSDAEKKRKYDLGYELDEINSGADHHPGHGRSGGGGAYRDQSDIFNMFFGGRRR
jgi:DnaJ family protein C protein 7